MPAHTATAKITDDGTLVVVGPEWRGVDRTYTDGISLPAKDRKLVDRLKRAIEAQVVYTNPVIATDTLGRTYMQAECLVLGRTLNADLKRLGF